jgi:CRISPR-associated protein Cas2
MFILVCYDVCDSRRLRRVAKLLEGYGQRVQESVFECHLDVACLSRMRDELDK